MSLSGKGSSVSTQREDIKKRIRELKEASGETWEDLKFGTEDAWQEMKAAIEKVNWNSSLHIGSFFMTLFCY